MDFMSSLNPSLLLNQLFFHGGVNMRGKFGAQLDDEQGPWRR